MHFNVHIRKKDILTNITNDLIVSIFDFCTKLDITILFHTNKQFNKISKKEKYQDNTRFIIYKGIYEKFLHTTNAAHEGNFDILIYLVAIGYDWNYNICLYAATNGDLQTLKWLKYNGCPLNEYSLICTYAAKNGHLETLQWLRDNDCK